MFRNVIRCFFSHVLLLIVSPLPAYLAKSTCHLLCERVTASAFLSVVSGLLSFKTIHLSVCAYKIWSYTVVHLVFSLLAADRPGAVGAPAGGCEFLHCMSNAHDHRSHACLVAINLIPAVAHTHTHARSNNTSTSTAPIYLFIYIHFVVCTANRPKL